MANYCNTEYILRGKAEDLNACAEVINKFAWGNYPQEDSKYGIYQLVDRETGGSVDNQDGRNDFHQAEIETDSDGTAYLQTWTTTAWKPEHGLVDKLCKKFNLTYLYFAEEPGSEVYETNDKEGLFFPDRYIVEQEETERWYHETAESVLKDIESRTGRTCKTLEDAEAAIEDYNEKHENDKITLIKIDVL
jgi:hypothetical protein